MGESLTKAAATFWSSVIAQAWEDEEFKQKLLDNAEEALKQIGYAEFLDPDGQKMNIKVEEAKSSASCAHDPETNTLTLYLPEKPECLRLLELKGQFLTGICC